MKLPQLRVTRKRVSWCERIPETDVSAVQGVKSNRIEFLHEEVVLILNLYPPGGAKPPVGVTSLLADRDTCNVEYHLKPALFVTSLKSPLKPVFVSKHE